jgi:hypothetical protein
LLAFPSDPKSTSTFKSSVDRPMTQSRFAISNVTFAPTSSASAPLAVANRAVAACALRSNALIFFSVVAFAPRPTSLFAFAFVSAARPASVRSTRSLLNIACSARENLGGAPSSLSGSVSAPPSRHLPQRRPSRRHSLRDRALYLIVPHLGEPSDARAREGVVAEHRIPARAHVVERPHRREFHARIRADERFEGDAALAREF